MRYRAGLETRARILDATRELLAEAGLDGTTIKAICARAGIQPGSFYNLFDSKEEAVLTAVRQAITAVDPDPAGLGEETTEDLIEAYIAFVSGEPTLARVYLRIAVGGALSDPSIGARLIRHHDTRVERLHDALARQDPSLSDEEATLQAEAILAALNGYAIHWILQPDFDFVGHARRLVPAAEPA